MTRTPDEIKKGLECCVIGPSAHQPKCGECPYMFVPMCSDTFLKDALALIQQIEARNTELLEKVEQLQAERDVLWKVIRRCGCELCKYRENEGDELPCRDCTDDRDLFELIGVQEGETENV